jgi:hypothetical protein
MGEPKHAERYCGKFAPSVDCVVDKTTKPYQAYGLSRGGVTAFFSSKVAQTARDLREEGIVGGQIIGDPLMLPGFFIVEQGGTVRYAYYAKDASDHPDMAHVIHAAQAMRAT